jgi:hypothetical protein
VVEVYKMGLFSKYGDVERRGWTVDKKRHLVYVKTEFLSMVEGFFKDAAGDYELVEYVGGSGITAKYQRRYCSAATLNGNVIPMLKSL